MPRSPRRSSRRSPPLSGSPAVPPAVPPSGPPSGPGPAPHPGPRLALARLRRSTDTPFLLRPDAAARRALAAGLGLSALPRLRFEGRVIPRGDSDWELQARLGATVVQPCVVTLVPVRTRIEEEVARLYAADYAEPAAEESEIPEDDRLEPLPESLDLAALMAEALALAVPLYPRAPGAEGAGAEGAGVEGAGSESPAPEAEDAPRVLPFAALAALRRKAPGEGGDGGDDDGGEAG